MKKSLIKVGQKLYWDGKKDNVAVTVIDVNLPCEQIGIIDGGITHVVNAEHLSATPSNQPTPAVETPVESVVKVESVQPVSTKPQIDLIYDDTVKSLFIVINDKTTVCIPNVAPPIVDAVGISYKHDDDNFNLEIGNALAYYRASANENSAIKNNKSALMQLFEM